MSPPYPFSLDLDLFLRGHPQKKLDVDHFFSYHFDEYLEENQKEIPDYQQWDKWQFISWYPSIRGVKLIGHHPGIVAINHKGKIIGCYLWSALLVHKNYRRQGLGRQLVITRIIRDQINPAAQLDNAAYSPNGLATHQSAWRTMRDQIWS